MDLEQQQTVLTKEQMRAIARYEARFEGYTQFGEEQMAAFEMPEKYRITPEDLLAAFRNLTEKDPEVHEFIAHWLFPIEYFREEFGLNDAFAGCTKYELTDPASDPDEVRGLAVNANDVILDVWDELSTLLETAEWSAKLSETKGLGEYREAIAMYLLGRTKPVWEREFTLWQKRNFVDTFGSDIRLARASEREILLFRAFADELAQKGDETALHIKGYACYGGNRAYPCDWDTAKDCMEKLFEKTDDPQYANTLGYIYYYGRCSGGVPDYEKAFRAFSLSAANGLHEGMYKLGDMYRSGYGVKKSARAARSLYGLVYNDSLKQFLEGNEGNFADAALRMGNAFRDGTGSAVDAEKAYAMYLEADFAARRRAERSGFFGDTAVAVNAKKALDEMKENVRWLLTDCVRTSWLWPLDRLTEKNFRCAVSVKKRENGDAEITVKRLPVRKDGTAEAAFITLPEISYCALVTELTVVAAECETSIEEEPLTVDYGERNPGNGRTELYFNGECAGWISCAEYRFYGENEEE